MSSTEMKVAQRHLEGLHCRQGDFLSFSSLNSVVEQLPPQSSPMVTVGHDASIADALSQLREHRVLSLPVYHTDQRRILGMADVLDICTFLCWGTVKSFEKDPDIASTIADLAKKMKETSMQTILEATRKDHNQRMVVKRQLDSVSSLIDQMARGLHRALVRTWPEAEDDQEEGRMTLDHYRIVSQMDVIRFLADHRRNLNHHLLHSTVADLGLAGPVVPQAAYTAMTEEDRTPSETAVAALLYSVEEGETALNSFRKLAISGVHAIGIVGIGIVGSGKKQLPTTASDRPTGRLLDNLSASDLRAITPDTVDLLQLPVEIFLSRVAQSGSFRPKRLITCEPEAKLIEVIDQIVRSGVHRVWVVDEQGRPTGLITLTDILSKFASFDYSQTHAAKKTVVSLAQSL